MKQHYAKNRYRNLDTISYQLVLGTYQESLTYRYLYHLPEIYFRRSGPTEENVACQPISKAHTDQIPETL